MEWMQFQFMKNALLAVLLSAPLFGLLGAMAVNQKMAFFSDAIGHSALTGIAIGVLLGFQEPLISMIGFSIILAVAITSVKNANIASADTVISVFSSTAVAAGIAILSRSGGFSKFSAFLIGDLLSIRPGDLISLGIALVLVLLFWIILFNRLMLLSVHSELAGSRGVKIILLENLFTILVAVVVTLAIRWVGILVINSLLILPAVASRNIARNMRQYHIMSVLFALISGITGLIVSFYMGTAAGATIVIVSAIIFGVTFLVKPFLKA